MGSIDTQYKWDRYICGPRRVPSWSSGDSDAKKYDRRGVPQLCIVTTQPHDTEVALRPAKIRFARNIAHENWRRSEKAIPTPRGPFRRVTKYWMRFLYSSAPIKLGLTWAAVLIVKIQTSGGISALLTLPGHTTGCLWWWSARWTIVEYSGS